MAPSPGEPRTRIVLHVLMTVEDMMFTNLWEKLQRLLAAWTAGEPAILCHCEPAPHSYRATPRWW